MGSGCQYRHQLRPEVDVSSTAPHLELHYPILARRGARSQSRQVGRQCRGRPLLYVLPRALHRSLLLRGGEPVLCGAFHRGRNGADAGLATPRQPLQRTGIAIIIGIIGIISIDSQVSDQRTPLTINSVFINQAPWYIKKQRVKTVTELARHSSENTLSLSLSLS